MKFETGEIKKGRNRCCVQECGSQAGVDSNLSFHKIPKYDKATVIRKNIFGVTEIVDKRKEWLRLLNIKNNKKNVQLYVCSLHFRKDDYFFPGTYKLFLKCLCLLLIIKICIYIL